MQPSVTTQRTPRYIPPTIFTTRQLLFVFLIYFTQGFRFCVGGQGRQVLGLHCGDGGRAGDIPGKTTHHGPGMYCRIHYTLVLSATAHC